MSNATQPKPTPVPGILVFGTPTNPALTQASWFRAEDKEAVKAAARELKSWIPHQAKLWFPVGPDSSGG
jgi:hypothetical protein